MCETCIDSSAVELCGILCGCMHIWLDFDVLYFTVLCAWSVAKSPVSYKLACVTFYLCYRGVSGFLEAISGVILSMKDCINMGTILSGYRAVGSGIKVVCYDTYLL
jgi:hypothetical protein